MDQALLVVDRAHQPKTGSWIARSAVDKGSTGFVFFSSRILAASHFVIIVG